MTETRMCPFCAGPLPPSHTRPRTWCSHACRQAAWSLERRAIALAERAAAAQAAWAKVRARKRGVDG